MRCSLIHCHCKTDGKTSVRQEPDAVVGAREKTNVTKINLGPPPKEDGCREQARHES